MSGAVGAEHRRTGLLGGLLTLAAAACALGGVLRGPEPIVVELPTGPPIGMLEASSAVVVPLALVAATVLAAGHRTRAASLVALGASAPIVLVVVAALNGVTDAGALVAVYALTAAGVLLRCVTPGSTRGLRLSAVVGVVPWGVVALAQVGGLLTATAPTTAVRVLTVVVLAAAFGEWLVAYRRRPAPPPLTAVAAAPLALAVLGAVLR